MRNEPLEYSSSLPFVVTLPIVTTVKVDSPNLIVSVRPVGLQVVPVAYDCITERRLSKTIYFEENACQFAVSCRSYMFQK